MIKGSTVPQLLAAAAETRGDDPWLIAPDGTHSFASIWTTAQQVAASLRSLGIRRGDRVGLFAGNGLGFIETWFGAMTAGATAVPVNTGFKSAEASYVLAHSGAVACLVDSDTAGVLAEARPSLPGLRHVLGDAPGAISPDELRRSAPLDDPDPHGSTPAGILYTSGTTGPPKGCVLGHDYYTVTPRSFAEHLGLDDTDVLLGVLPLFHMNAQTLSVLGSLTAGARLVLEDRFHASSFWETVRRHGVTEINYLGVISSVLFSQPPSQYDRDHAVRVGFGAGIPASIHAAFEERFGFPMIEVFGMTETGLDLATPLEGERRVGSRTVGLPVPGKEAKLVTDTGGSPLPGEPGDLLVRGPALFQGYYDDPEATRAAFTADGWFRTGDLASRSEDGWFHFVDRRKDILRRAGENISSVEVETVIRNHPGVAEVAVIGAPDDIVGQEVLAVVIASSPNPGEELAEEIFRRCEQQLARFKVPRFVRFVQDLPRTQSQKIQKHRLRDLYGDTTGAHERHWRPA